MSVTTQILNAAKEAYNKRDDKNGMMDNPVLGTRVGNALINMRNHAIVVHCEDKYYWMANQTTIIYMNGDNYAAETLFPLLTAFDIDDEDVNFQFFNNLPYGKVELTKIRGLQLSDDTAEMLFFRLLVGTPEIDQDQLRLLYTTGLAIVPKTHSAPMAIPKSVTYDPIDYEDDYSWDKTYNTSLYSVKTKFYKLFNPRDANLELLYVPNSPPVQTAFNSAAFGKTWFEGVYLTDAMDMIMERLTYGGMMEALLDFLKAFCEGKVVINVVAHDNSYVDDFLTYSFYTLMDDFFCMRQWGGIDVLELNNGSAVDDTNIDYRDREVESTNTMNPAILLLSALMPIKSGSMHNMMLFLEYARNSERFELYRFAYAMFRMLSLHRG